MNYFSKLPNVGATIFATMSKLAQQHGAINLSQGFPNFSTSNLLKAAAQKAIEENHNQYAPLQGIPKLVEAIIQKTNSLYGSSYNRNEVCVTAGATQGIFSIFSAFLRPKDEVIVFKPAYDCYEPAIELNGATSVLIELKTPTYGIDWEEVKKKISPQTKMIVINNPHNPSGKVFTEEDMHALEKLVKDSNILILSDEVYEHMTFDGRAHLSIAKYPELQKRSFLVASFGKTFHVTGWKTGYVLAPENLMDEFKKVHQYNVFCVNHPMQVALAEHLQEPENYLHLPSFYQAKRDYFNRFLEASSFDIIPTEGSYFQLANYEAISSKKDTDFCLELIEKYGVATIPVSVFNKDQECRKLIRFCFAKDEATLEKAGKILEKL